MADQKGWPFLLAESLAQHPIAAISVVIGVLATLWLSIGRVYYLRWFYERQGVVFVQNCYPVIGAELYVSKLQGKNKSHDWLYGSSHADIIGTIRGSTIQLYGVTAEICDKLLRETGKSVDRDSPALFSFGRLSPFAIPFTPMCKPLFRQRKANLIRALTDVRRLYQIANNQAARVLASFNEKGKGRSIDIRKLVDEWSEETSGVFLWGRNATIRTVRAYDPTGQLTDLPLMTAFHYTDVGLRVHSSNFWNRIYFPLAAWPITKKARQLTYNIRVLQTELDNILAHPEEGTVAERLKKENDSIRVPSEMTRDDLMTGTIGGLDSVKAAIMATLWNLLQPSNEKWRREILSEIEHSNKYSSSAWQTPAHGETLNAVVFESMRTHPPGSLINNRATADFDLLLPDKAYKIKSGTRIVSCVHALNQSNDCWDTVAHPNMTSLDRFDPTRFVRWGDEIIGSTYFMPFGKGTRRCAGQPVALMMVKCFVTAFLQSNSECLITIPKEQSRDTTRFSVESKATFIVHGNDKVSSRIKV